MAAMEGLFVSLRLVCVLLLLQVSRSRCSSGTEEEEAKARIQAFIPTISPDHVYWGGDANRTRAELPEEDPTLEGDPLDDLSRLPRPVTKTPTETPLILTIDEDVDLEEALEEDLASRKTAAPFGSWNSPISSQFASERFDLRVKEAPFLDPVGGLVFWVEDVSQGEGGGPLHRVLSYDSETSDKAIWTPSGFDVRADVYGNGGGAFTVYNNSLFFVNAFDGQVYRQDGHGGIPRKLTDVPYRRYSDFSYSPQMEVLACVVEDREFQEEDPSQDSEHGIVFIDSWTGEVSVVSAFAKFFSSPRFSEDSSKLAWIQWGSLKVPWTDNQMLVVDVMNDKGKVQIKKLLQHGSMMMPKWNANNELLYVHDATGWWNLYIVNRRNFEKNLTPVSQEVGWPMWSMGRQAFDVNPIIGRNEAVVICGKELLLVDTATLERKVLNTSYDSYSMGVAYSQDGNKVYVVAGDSTRVPRMIEVNVRTGDVKVIGHYDSPINASYISTPIQLQFPSSKDNFAYGYLYLPKNAEYKGLPGMKPPLLVKAHSGPTGAASTTLNWEYQFFTSRGFAILDVDYRGSAGYGKVYRTLLDEHWGIYDVDDCSAGAEYLVQKRLVNQDMVCISGYSEGGFTALSSLLAKSIFKAGASRSGVVDLLQLRSDANTFNRKYIESLVGNFDSAKERYVARSPLHNKGKLDKPVLFLHGAKDHFVPVEQVRRMQEASVKASIPSSLVVFEDEGHTLYRRESRKKALEAEIYFYGQVFNFGLPGINPDIDIVSLEKWKIENRKWTKITLS